MGLSTVNPNIFFVALDYAGAFSISVLGGILPAIMAWKLRYTQETSNLSWSLAPGGKVMLVTLGGISVALIGEHFLALVI